MGTIEMSRLVRKSEASVVQYSLPTLRRSFARMGDAFPGYVPPRHPRCQECRIDWYHGAP